MKPFGTTYALLCKWLCYPNSYMSGRASLLSEMRCLSDYIAVAEWNIAINATSQPFILQLIVQLYSFSPIVSLWMIFFNRLSLDNIIFMSLIMLISSYNFSFLFQIVEHNTLRRKSWFYKTYKETVIHLKL